MQLNKKQEEKNSILTQLKTSIKSDDISYIQEFLLYNDPCSILKLLKDDEKDKLSVMCIEFINTPLRLNALEIIKEIAECMKNKKLVYTSLKKRAVDIEKLVYLKGKIDYIHMTRMKEEVKEPEEVI